MIYYELITLDLRCNLTNSSANYQPKELAESPRQGLLIKCMAKREGDENKAKALYLETRVNEMKKEVKHGIKRQKAEETRKT